MRVSLIDVDSKIPNLALMKLSAYHKKMGDVTGLSLSDPDRVYISVVFSENVSQAMGIAKMFDCLVIVGGYYADVTLPSYIDHSMPDYGLYGIDYSMGFTTRGCIRNCSFCDVPRFEGMIHVSSDIYEFWNPDHSRIVLLDNNILAMPTHFEDIAFQLLYNNLIVDFNQGLDIRLVNDYNAQLLSCLRVQPQYRFAFDNPSIEDDVVRGIEILKSHGINSCQWYVLVGFNTNHEQDLYRLNLLKELGQRVYVMRYRGQHYRCTSKWYNDLAAWGNQPRFFRSMDFEDFVRARNKSRQLEVIE